MTQPEELQQTSKSKSPDTKPITLEQTLQRIQITLALLPVFTACIYLFGMSWHAGYLSVFHVDSSEFPLSTEQTILMGVISVTSKILPKLGYPIAAFVAFFFLWVIYALTAQLLKSLGNRALKIASLLVNNELFQRVIRWVFRYSIRQNEAAGWNQTLDRARSWYFRFCYVIGTAAITFFMAYFSYVDGGDFAKKQIKQISQGTFASANQLRYAKHPEGVSAIRIVCNAIQCTFWTKADGTIFLRHDQIDSVVIPLENKKPTSKK